jgi:hypothetical protein
MTQMKRAVVVNSAIWTAARTALLLRTSRATVLVLTAIRMLMERALSVVPPQITIYYLDNFERTQVYVVSVYFSYNSC